MFCSSTYRYKTHIFLDAVPKTFVKFSGGYFSDTLLVVGFRQGRRRDHNITAEIQKF